MRSARVAFTLVGVAVLCAASMTLSCAGDDTAGSTADASPDVTSAFDATLTDADDAGSSRDSSGGDVNPPDADASSVAPSPRLLVSGSHLRVEGLTDDGWVIYDDDSATPHVVAVPVAGGASVVLASLGLVRIVGNVVWVRPSDQSPAAVFSAATGVHTLTAGSDLFAATADGTRVVVDVGTNGTYDLVEANTDLTNQKHLISSQCARVVSTGTHFITWSCFTDPHIELWDVAGAKSALDTTSLSAIAGLAFAPGHIYASATSADGGYLVEALPLDGGTPTWLVGSSSPVSDQIAVSPDGQRLIYTNSSGVYSTPTSVPAPVPLVGTHAGTYTFSSDSKWLAVRSAGSGHGPVLNPYSLSSTTAGGALFYNDGGTSLVTFTNDSGYAAVLTDDADGGALVASLANLADVVRVSMTTVQPAGPSRLVFVGYLTQDGGVTRSTLAVMSANDPGTIEVIAAADPSFAVDATRERVVFATSAGSAPGLYYTALPK